MEADLSPIAVRITYPDKAWRKVTLSPRAGGRELYDAARAQYGTGASVPFSLFDYANAPVDPSAASVRYLDKTSVRFMLDSVVDKRVDVEASKPAVRGSSQDASADVLDADVERVNAALLDAYGDDTSRAERYKQDVQVMFETERDSEKKATELLSGLLKPRQFLYGVKPSALETIQAVMSRRGWTYDPSTYSWMPPLPKQLRSYAVPPLSDDLEVSIQTIRKRPRVSTPAPSASEVAIDKTDALTITDLQVAETGTNADRLRLLLKICKSANQRQSWLYLQVMADALQEKDTSVRAYLTHNRPTVGWSKVSLCTALYNVLTQIGDSAPKPALRVQSSMPYPNGEEGEGAIEPYGQVKFEIPESADIAYAFMSDPRIGLPEPSLGGRQRPRKTDRDADVYEAVVADKTTIEQMKSRNMVHPTTKEPMRYYSHVRLRPFEKLLDRAMLQTFGVSRDVSTQSVLEAEDSPPAPKQTPTLVKLKRLNRLRQYKNKYADALRSLDEHLLLLENDPTKMLVLSATEHACSSGSPEYKEACTQMLRDWDLASAIVASAFKLLVRVPAEDLASSDLERVEAVLRSDAAKESLPEIDAQYRTLAHALIPGGKDAQLMAMMLARSVALRAPGLVAEYAAFPKSAPGAFYNTLLNAVHASAADNTLQNVLYPGVL